MNKIMIVGRLGADPSFHTFQNGGQNAKFSVATTEYWIDRSTGEKCEETEWHRCVANGGIAERVERLKKGSLVAIEGRNRTRDYTDKNGIERTVTQIQISKLEILDGANKSGTAGGSNPSSAPSRNPSAQAASQGQPAQPVAQASGQQGGDDGYQDDIPF